MIVELQNKQINIANIKKVSPSIVVELEDTVTPISLEWYEINKDSVNLLHYLLMIYFKDETKLDFKFDNEDEMLEVAIELDILLRDIKK